MGGDDLRAIFATPADALAQHALPPNGLFEIVVQHRPPPNVRGPRPARNLPIQLSSPEPVGAGC